MFAPGEEPSRRHDPTIPVDDYGDDYDGRLNSVEVKAEARKCIKRPTIYIVGLPVIGYIS